MEKILRFLETHPVGHGLHLFQRGNKWVASINIIGNNKGDSLREMYSSEKEVMVDALEELGNVLFATFKYEIPSQKQAESPLNTKVPSEEKVSVKTTVESKSRGRGWGI